MANPFRLGERVVGGDAACLVMAEVAQAHDGSLGTAHAYIDAMADVGCEAIKFQTHIASAESTRSEPWRVRFSSQDQLRYDYWRRMEFPESAWHELAAHTRERGLLFLSSPFSMEAVELLARVGVPGWKIGAGEIDNLPMIHAMAKTGLPVLLSSGMSLWEELDAAVETVQDAGAPVAVYQCTTAYPCPPERTGLNVLAELRERYGCPIGLSDHSGKIYAGLAAAALGADLLELHVVLDRRSFGPDAPASVTPEEFAQLVEGTQAIHTMRVNPVDKQSAAADMQPLRETFGKNIVASRDLPKGHVLSADDLALKKAGGGLTVSAWNQCVGRTLKGAVAADTPIDLENVL